MATNDVYAMLAISFFVVYTIYTIYQVHLIDEKIRYIERQYNDLMKILDGGKNVFDYYY